MVLGKFVLRGSENKRRRKSRRRETGRELTVLKYKEHFERATEEKEERKDVTEGIEWVRERGPNQRTNASIHHVIWDDRIPR